MHIAWSHHTAPHSHVQRSRHQQQRTPAQQQHSSRMGDLIPHPGSSSGALIAQDPEQVAKAREERIQEVSEARQHPSASPAHSSCRAVSSSISRITHPILPAHPQHIKLQAVTHQHIPSHAWVHASTHTSHRSHMLKQSAALLVSLCHTICIWRPQKKPQAMEGACMHYLHTHMTDPAWCHCNPAGTASSCSGSRYPAVGGAVWGWGWGGSVWCLESKSCNYCIRPVYTVVRLVLMCESVMRVGSCAQGSSLSAHACAQQCCG